jgi:hydrogenase-4 component E
MLEIILLLIIFSILILWVIGNYKNFIRRYTIQVALILAVFYFLYANNFLSDFMLLASFISAIIIRLFFIPRVLNKSVNKSWLPIVERKFKFWRFFTLLIYLTTLLFIAFLSKRIFETYNLIFIAGIFIVISSFLNFENHNKLVWDILSFLELENWIFLISLLIIGKVNFYIELGIIIDILMSLSILIISAIKIKKEYWTIDIDQLAELKE